MQSDQWRMSSQPIFSRVGINSQGWGAAFVADTYAAIRGEKHIGLPNFEDGARSMAIVEAVLRSAKSNAWTKIE